MKRVKVPAAIRLINHHTGEPSESKAFEWSTFALVLLNDPRMIQKQTDIATLVKMVNLVVGAKEGDDIDFEDADHERFMIVVDDPFVTSPRTGQRISYWEPLTMVQIQPFFTCLRDTK